MIATVTINGKVVAELLANEDANGLQFQAAELRQVLEPWVRPELLRLIFAGRNEVSSAALENSGLVTAWDSERLVYTVLVPAAMSPVRYIEVSRSRPSPVGKLYTPEALSAILNFQGRAAYTDRDGIADLPLSLDANLFINLDSWVLELGASALLEASDHALTLNKARFVRDFPSADARLVAGRIETPAIGFQSIQPLLGIVFQNKTFSPSRRLVMPGMNEFVLKNGGNTRVFLNGLLLRSERLEPGTYLLSDLPFASGLNNLELEVQESGAETRRYAYLQPHDESFLGTGGVDYALAFGFEESTETRPMGSGFLRLGLGERADTSFSFQYGFGSALFGGSLALATLFGNLSVDSAFSMPVAPAVFPPGYAFTSRYRLAFPGRPELPNIGLTAQYTSRGFSAPRVSFASEPPAPTLRLSGALTSALPGAASISLAAENRLNLDDRTGTTNVALTLRSRVSEGLTVSGLGNLVFQPDGAIKPSLAITVLASPGGTGRNFQYSQGLIKSSSSFELSGPLGRSNDLEASFRGRNVLAYEDDVSQVSAQLRLRRPFGDFGTTASWEFDPQTGQAARTASLSASGALVYAGGQLRYTRPVADSFVLLVPDDSLAGNTVELQLGSNSTSLRSQNNRPGVAPLTSYRLLQGYLNLPEASPELTTDETFVVLAPTYRSAIVLRPELKPNLSVAGFILDRNGQPLPWLIGRLSNAAGELVDQGFTDSDGRFEFYGLVPGEYTVSWSSRQTFVIGFEVSGSDTSIRELGAFRLAGASVEVNR